MSTCLLWQILRKPTKLADNSDAYMTEMAKCNSKKQGKITRIRMKSNLC
jgi:hypothetical protein